MTAVIPLPVLPLAACRDESPELFFYEGDPAADANARQIAQAKQVCSGCGSRSDCLRFAISIGAQGVWGGLTEDERQAEGRRQRGRRHRETRRAAA